MAVTLVLDVPQKVTLDVTLGDLLQVTVPAGTRYLEYSSDSDWYYEVDTGQADSAAGTATAQQRIGSGTGSLRCPGSGSGRARLPGDTDLFLAGAGASQVVWLTATSRGV